VSRLLNGTVTPGDALRYGRQTAGMPGYLLHYAADKKPVVVWNITRRCNLFCLHCYMDSHDREYPGELSTDEGRQLLDGLAAFGVPTVIFSGGEPLVRPDLFELAAHARDRGLRCVLSTNGTLITPEAACRIRDAGFAYAGISLDGIGPAHDKVRGKLGAYEESLAGLRRCRDLGVRVGLRVTIHRKNADQLPAIFDLLETEDIPRCCIYHLAYAGRGDRIRAYDLEPTDTRRAVDYIFARTRDFHRRGIEKEILTVDNHADGPYLYLTVLRDQPERAEEVYRLLSWNGGNQSGVAIGSVDSQGYVHADAFSWHYSFGNVRQRPFGAIWVDTSEPRLAVLKDRKAHLKGRCRSCRYLDICNGNLRVRAERYFRDVLAPDPACYLTDPEIGILPDTPEAEEAAKWPVPVQVLTAPPHAKSVQAVGERRARDSRLAEADFDQAPFTIAWEVTRACAFACRHCRAEARPQRDPQELGTEEAFRLIDEIKRFGDPILVVTGGDPMMRPEVHELLAYAVQRGLRTSLTPTTTRLVTPRALARVRDAGVGRVAISIDGPSAESHDTFRGVRGSFELALNIARGITEAGLSLQVNTTVSRYNIGLLDAMAELVGELGAVQWSLFFLVPMGRARAADMISPEEHEQVFHWLYDLSRRAPFDVKSTAAPAYRRVVIQRERGGQRQAGASQPSLTVAGAGYRFEDGLDRPVKAVNDGKGFCFISHTGDVCPSGFLPLAAGNVRRQSVVEIYRTAPLFRSLRDATQLRGKCGRCEFREVCGGSRARAYAVTGDYLAEDPSCVFQPATVGTPELETV
jgi:radical SAM protein